MNLSKGDMVRVLSRMFTHKKGAIGFIKEIKHTIGGSIYYKVEVKNKRHWHSQYSITKTTPLSEAMREND